MNSDDSFDPFAPEPDPAADDSIVDAASIANGDAAIADSRVHGIRYLQPQPHAFVISSAEVIWGSYLGILLAANVYAILFTWFWGLAITLMTGIVDLSGVMCCGTFLSVLVASFLSTLFALVAISLVTLFNFSLGSIWHPITAAGIVGGFTGFGCTCGILFNPVGNFDWTWFAWIYFIGPILAMVFGQLGAMIFAARCIRNFYAEQQVRVAKFVKEDPRGLQQFGIKQLLVLTAWMGGLSAILSAVYRFSENGLIPVVILSYFFLQILTFYFCRLVLRRWIGKHLRTVAHISNSDDYLGVHKQ